MFFLLAECSKPLSIPGAEEVNRTPDLLITNQLLYQLSYFGNCLVSKEKMGVLQGLSDVISLFLMLTFPPAPFHPPP